MSKPIQTLTIPKYVTQIKTSNKRRPKYYQFDKKKFIWKPKDLPSHIRKKLDKSIYKVSGEGFLLDESGNKVVANPKTAGTEKYEQLSGNKFFSGYGSYHIRRKLTGELKKFYKPFVKKLEPITVFPLRIEWDFYTIMNKADWDMDNMSFYWKYLQDTLVDQGIIPEDNIRYITFPPSGKFIPVDDWEERKFVIRFYHDDRDEIIKLWNKENYARHSV